MAIQTSLPLPLFIATTFLRFLQFVFAIAVLGLYGTDINSARKVKGVSIPSKWIYAEVVGTLSALTAIVYCLPKINAKAYWASAWDGILLFVIFFLPFFLYFFPVSFPFPFFLSFTFNSPSPFPPLQPPRNEKKRFFPWFSFCLPIELKMLIKTLTADF